MFRYAGPVEDRQTGYDWSQIDLGRHTKLMQHAGPLLAIRGTLWDLDQILRDFVAAAAAAGMRLDYRREPEALAWKLTLVGPNFCAAGTVQIALETPTCASIVARPEGQAPLVYQAIQGEEDDFAELLRDEFRSAAVSSVLDSDSVVTP